MSAPLARRRLIVTADDFGLAPEVNEAVECAHRDGVLSAASLMVAGAAAADAVARARKLPTLAVGLHIVLVDGAPVLPASRIPNLVGARGLFRRDLARLGLEIALCANVRRQLRDEIRAQFEAFCATGLPLRHVDVHKHYHLHPIVASEVIAAGRAFGMTALRTPREPAWVAEGDARAAMASRMLRPFASSLRRRARAAGLATADAVFGLAWSGALSEARILQLIARLPDGLSEIYCHPATGDDFQGHAPGYGYRREFAALLSPQVAAAIEQRGLRLTSFACEAGAHSQDA